MPITSLRTPPPDLAPTPASHPHLPAPSEGNVTSEDITLCAGWFEQRY